MVANVYEGQEQGQNSIFMHGCFNRRSCAYAGTYFGHPPCTLTVASANGGSVDITDVNSTLIFSQPDGHIPPSPPPPPPPPVCFHDTYT